MRVVLLFMGVMIVIPWIGLDWIGVGGGVGLGVGLGGVGCETGGSERSSKVRPLALEMEVRFTPTFLSAPTPSNDSRSLASNLALSLN
jgi:hypothetical protein